MIRAAAIVHALLGNTGRPGGGVIALRGHASIQGSTDIPTLYNLLPGYIAQPHFAKPHHSLKSYLKTETLEMDGGTICPNIWSAYCVPGMAIVRRRKTNGVTHGCRRSWGIIPSCRWTLAIADGIDSRAIHHRARSGRRRS